MVTRENNIWLERKKISTHLNDPPLVKKKTILKKTRPYYPKGSPPSTWTTQEILLFPYHHLWPIGEVWGSPVQRF
jgi:hypothetical protein